MRNLVIKLIVFLLVLIVFSFMMNGLYESRGFEKTVIFALTLILTEMVVSKFKD